MHLIPNYCIETLKALVRLMIGHSFDTIILTPNELGLSYRSTSETIPTLSRAAKISRISSSEQTGVFFSSLALAVQ